MYNIQWVNRSNHYLNPQSIESLIPLAKTIYKQYFENYYLMLISSTEFLHSKPPLLSVWVYSSSNPNKYVQSINE